MSSYHDEQQRATGDFKEDSETSRTQRTRTTQRPGGPRRLRDSEDLDDLEGPGSECVADANAPFSVSVSGEQEERAAGRSEKQRKEHHRLFVEGKYGDIPVPVFVELAAQESSSTPENYPAWRSTTWEFTRCLKSHPKLSHLTADEVVGLIDFDAIGFDEDDAMQFLVEWNRVKFIPGVKPLDWAATMAKTKPLASKRKFGRYNEFISIAAWLQVLVGRENTIFLPTEKIGELLGCSARQVSTLRQLALQDKLLEMVEQHQPRRRATRFKFLGECPVLEEYES